MGETSSPRGAEATRWRDVPLADGTPDDAGNGEPRAESKNFSFWCENETRYYNAERIRLDEVGDVHGHLLDLSVVELFNFPQHRDVLGGDKVDRDTLSAESTTSTDSVDVVLLARGQVVVDNERNLLNVDTSSEQVGGDQDSG